MSRVLLLGLLLVTAYAAAGCQNSSQTSAPGGPATTAGVPGAPLSADDQLMLDYLQARNEYAELLEKKSSGPKIREVAERSSAKLRELQALPRDRQMAVQTKYQKEWDAAKERVNKAIQP